LYSAPITGDTPVAIKLIGIDVVEMDAAAHTTKNGMHIIGCTAISH